MSGVDIAGLVERLGRIAKVGFGYDIDDKDRKALRAAADALQQAAEPAGAKGEIERLRGRLPCKTSTLGQSVYNLLKLAFARDPKAEVKVAGTCGVALIAHLEAQERALFEDAKAYADAAKLQRVRAESAEHERDEALAALKAAREALEPFADIAAEYTDQEDDDFQVWRDFDVLGATLPLLIFRRARSVLENRAQGLADATNNPPSDPGTEQREAGV